MAVGDWIAASHLWRENEEMASRLEILPPGWSRAQITGTWLDGEAENALRIGGANIRGLTPQHLQSGDIIRASDRADKGGIQAEQLRVSDLLCNCGLVHGS